MEIELYTGRPRPYKPRVSAPFAQPIDATTRYCAVFGHPIKHSASPAMQNAGLAALGFNWRYLAFDVHPDHLAAALAGAKQMDFIGLNLTVPHKLLALDLVDARDESAQTWGAVNTIRFERAAGGQVIARGFNTDADAIARSLQEDLGVELPGARVLLLGAGGAGRTAALKLASAGVAALALVNRTESKAREIAAEINRKFPGVVTTAVYPAAEVDLVLNATSLGLQPDDPLPFDSRRFSLQQARAAYDMVYRPAETPFLRAAQAAGCRTANGLGMLLYQGAKALEIWTGQPAPVDVMRAALKKNVYGS
jgi:shikimate dehydrogenase